MVALTWRMTGETLSSSKLLPALTQRLMSCSRNRPLGPIRRLPRPTHIHKRLRLCHIGLLSCTAAIGLGPCASALPSSAATYMCMTGV